MPQSHSAVHVHAVFSTKDRRPFLRDAGLRGEMHAYLASVSQNLDCTPFLVGGIEDHVHILAGLGRTITQADWVKEIKRVSSIWIKERTERLGDFAWQAGYGIFSVSTSNIKAVCNYIEGQEEHHRKSGFQEEFRALLRKHRLEWDERYVWD